VGSLGSCAGTSNKNNNGARAASRLGGDGKLAAPLPWDQASEGGSAAVSDDDDNDGTGAPAAVLSSSSDDDEEVIEGGNATTFDNGDASAAALLFRTTTADAVATLTALGSVAPRGGDGAAVSDRSPPSPPSQGEDGGDGAWVTSFSQAVKVAEAKKKQKQQQKSNSAAPAGASLTHDDDNLLSPLPLRPAGSVITSGDDFWGAVSAGASLLLPPLGEKEGGGEEQLSQNAASTLALTSRPSVVTTGVPGLGNPLPSGHVDSRSSSDAEEEGEGGGRAPLHGQAFASTATTPFAAAANEAFGAERSSSEDDAGGDAGASAPPPPPPEADDAETRAQDLWRELVAARDRAEALAAENATLLAERDDDDNDERGKKAKTTPSPPSSPTSLAAAKASLAESEARLAALASELEASRAALAAAEEAAAGAAAKVVDSSAALPPPPSSSSALNPTATTTSASVDADALKARCEELTAELEELGGDLLAKDEEIEALQGDLVRARRAADEASRLAVIEAASVAAAASAAASAGAFATVSRGPFASGGALPSPDENNFAAAQQQQ